MPRDACSMLLPLRPPGFELVVNVGESRSNAGEAPIAADTAIGPVAVVGAVGALVALRMPLASVALAIATVAAIARRVRPPAFAQTVLAAVVRLHRRRPVVHAHRDSVAQRHARLGRASALHAQIVGVELEQMGQDAACHSRVFLGWD